jgi:hypothetical protein
MAGVQSRYRYGTDANVTEGYSNERGSWGRSRVRLEVQGRKAMFRELATGDLAAALDGAASSDDGGLKRVRYTTKDGRKRWATQAQVDHWTRGGS